MRPAVLVVTDVVPGERSAGEARLGALCRLLAVRAEVVLVAVDRHLDDGSDQGRVDALRYAGIDVPRGHGVDAVRAALARQPFDLVFAEFWHVAERILPLARRRQPWARVAVDTVDLHFLRDERGAALGQPGPADAATRKRRELATYAAADVRIFVSDQERTHFLGVSVPVAGEDLVIPTIDGPRPRSRRRRDPLVVFVANYWHAPNLDGIEWFAQQVWPSVRAAVPTATLVLAGSRSHEVAHLAPLEGVEVRGFVDDLVALYQNASAAIAPLRYGAGIKGKVTGALAAGLPVVATTVAVEGLELVAGEHCVVADDPDAFSEGVVRLLSDAELAAEMGARGQERLSVLFAPALVEAAVERLLSPTAGPWPAHWWLRSLPERLWCWTRPRMAAGVRTVRSTLRPGRS